MLGVVKVFVLRFPLGATSQLALWSCLSLA